MIRVFILDDVRVFRQALAAFLRTRNGIAVVGAAALCESALAALCDLDPDVTLVNVSLAGVAAVRAVTKAMPDANVLAVGLQETEQEVVAHAEAGIAGYVTRESSLEDLAETLEGVSRGEMPVSSRISATLLRRVATLAEDRRDRHLSILTPREAEIAKLVGEGLSNKEIARRLSIEVRTVKNHVHSIFEKLHVRSRGALQSVVANELNGRTRRD